MDQLKDVLYGVVGFVEGGFKFAVWSWLLGRLMMKEAVGEGSAELLMKEDEQQRDLCSFLCEAIRVALPVSGEQPMRFHFAQIVSELVESIAVGADAEGGQDGFVDLACGPAGY